MKTVTFGDLKRKARACVDASQELPIVITRHGKPAAVLVGIEGQDWETVALQTSTAFWKLIERRRKEPTLSLEELRERLRKPAARKTLRRAGAASRRGALARRG